MCVAFFSTNSTKLLSPPSAFVAALLDVKPPTLRVTLLTAALCAVGARGICDVSPRCLSRFCWSREFDFGPVARELPRRDGALGVLLGPAPDLVLEAAPMSRSPSRSSRGAVRPRFEMPPRGAPREAPVEFRVFREVVEDAPPPREPPREPVGGAITTVGIWMGMSKIRAAPVRRERVANEARARLDRRKVWGSSKELLQSHGREWDKEVARSMEVNRRGLALSDEVEVCSTPRPSRTGSEKGKPRPVKEWIVEEAEWRFLIVYGLPGYR